MSHEDKNKNPKIVTCFCGHKIHTQFVGYNGQVWVIRSADTTCPSCKQPFGFGII